MPEYQLEIKQVVDYPRCRIYRQFIQSLIKDRSIRVSGDSGLFYFTVLQLYKLYIGYFSYRMSARNCILPRTRDVFVSRMGLTILCGDDTPVTIFELTLYPVGITPQGGLNNEEKE